MKQCRLYKALEERMRLVRTGFEFGVILNAHIERTVGKLDRFDKSAIGRKPRERHSAGGQSLAVIVVEFIAVTVTLAYLFRTVALLHCRAGLYHAGIGSGTKRTALVDIVALTGHEVYDLVRALLIKFARMSVLYSGNVSRIFYNRYLHTEADTEVRDVSFSCVLCREDHTLYPAASEASGNDYSVKPTELFLDIETLYRLGIYPFDPDLCTVCISRVTERLGNRKIGIVKLNILAPQTDGPGLAAVLDAAYTTLSAGNIRLR